MKKGIHPQYNATEIRCACGAVIETRSTKDSITVQICSNCHPFFTGKQKLVDTAGRIERFKNKFSGKTVAAKKSTKVEVKPARRPEPQKKTLENLKDKQEKPRG